MSDRRMIAPIVVDGKALFVSRGGVVDPGEYICIVSHCNNSIYVALDRFISTTAHGAFANYVISNNKTPIFEYVSKNFQSSVVYPEKQLILLAIRDNLTGNVFCELIQFVHAVLRTVQFLQCTERGSSSI